MLNPTDAQLEQYFWGERLSPEMTQICERRVFSDPELLHEYHQVSRLRVRFKELREELSAFEEEKRHRWFLRSLREEPIPRIVVIDVEDAINSLLRGQRVTRMLRAEIDRRLGRAPRKHEVADMDSRDRRVMTSQSTSMPPPNFELSQEFLLNESELPPKRPPMSKRERIQARYPEVIDYLRRYHRRLWERWVDEGGYSPVLKTLETGRKHAPLMAALELINLAARSNVRRK